MTTMAMMGAASVYADEAVLIDFNKLTPDTMSMKDPNDPQKTVFTENKQTMMDFSSLAGQGYTEDQKKQMKVSLAIANWEVVLASSSRNNINQSLSKTKSAKISDNAAQYKGQNVLGIRVHFPVEPFNSWARIQPPYSIPAFEPKASVDDQGNITPVADTTGQDRQNARLSRFEGSYDQNSKIKSAFGIVKNVGAIKKLAVNVKGLNFPHSLSVVLKDQDEVESVHFVGYLNFNGWKTLEWENPAYVKEVRNRQLRIYPLYPNSTPFVKLDSFLIQRDADAEGGDFITYIKDVKIIYDTAVFTPDEVDIDDESVWGITKDREDQRKKVESRHFGQQQVLRYLEQLKQETKENFTASDGQATDSKATAK
jgi:hypothetical protein